MRMLLAIGLGLIAPLPLAAQQAKAPVIPILIAPSVESQKVAVTVDRGLQSSKRLRSRALRIARDAMHKGEPISTENLRALGQAGDGLAAQRYVRTLLSDKTQANPSDIAYFAAVAVGTGRVWTLKPMIEAMYQLDPKSEPKERINTYIRVLYPHAWAGNSLALEALVAFNGEGRLFGPLSDKTRDRILAEARALGDGRTELSLAMGILEVQRASDTPDADAIAQAHSYLERAAGSDHLAVSTTAQNLLRMIDNG